MDDNRQSANDDALAELIRAAGRRATPPPRVQEQVFASASETWQAKVRSRRQRTWAWRAAAAVACVAVISALIVDRAPVPGAEVARLERIIGTVETRVADDMDWNVLVDADQGVNAGNRLRTGAGSRAGIQLGDDISLRLADSTEILFESSSVIRLQAGMLYVDTGDDTAAQSRIEIVTDAGTARDIGTQFEVRYSESTYRLRVREGRVMLTRSTNEHDANEYDSRAGEQLLIDTDGRIETAAVARDDPEWQWVESVAPAPDIENQPVTVLLKWVGRETGREVRYAEPGIEVRAEQTILHGNIRYLPPMKALDVMLATTDLGYEVQTDGTIIIRLK